MFISDDKPSKKLLVKCKKRKLFQYTEKDLTDELHAVKKQGMKIKTAAEKFKVPRTTLRDKLKAENVPVFGKKGLNVYWELKQKKNW